MAGFSKVFLMVHLDTSNNQSNPDLGSGARTSSVVHAMVLVFSTA